ncbi:938_t:CDS:2 [Gigaspora margarita]|uniref:938_t:CDS:1 n=1 Tax=Gigaspora margarita TaxID=4874 RepID=A0ABN7V5I2_GIGMA|nr:938_t:CDS:2 [Gigaspora margarita]
MLDKEEDKGNTDIEELLSKHFDLYVCDSTKYGGFFKQTQSYLMLKKEKGYGDVYGDKSDMNNDKDEIRTIDVVPIEELSSGTHNPVLVGEVKLTELKC